MTFLIKYLKNVENPDQDPVYALSLKFNLNHPKLLYIYVFIYIFLPDGVLC